MDSLTWSLLLLGLGLAFILLEIYVPSGGALGVMAALSIIGAITVAFLGSPRQGVGILITATILVPIAVWFAIRSWPQTAIGRRVIMPRMKSEDVLPDGEQSRLNLLIGKRGVAKSPMLPSGVIVIEGRSYDATSEGMAIDVGETVRVIAVRTHRLIVRPANGEPVDATPATRSDELLAQPLDAIGLDPFEDPLA